MGPRLVNRGNARVSAMERTMRSASMGPRLVNRGNEAAEQYFIHSLSSFNGAEIS